MSIWLGLFILAGLLTVLVGILILWFFLLKPLFRLERKLEQYLRSQDSPNFYLSIPRYYGIVNKIIISTNAILRKLADARATVQAHASLLELRIEERTKELLQLANYDIVTELPNQNLLQEFLSQAIVQKKQTDIIAIFTLELLDFHEIRNALGHTMGNVILKGIASYLTGNLPQDAFIAHTNTQNFTIVKTELNNTMQISSLAQWISDLFSKPIHIASHPILTTINMGVSIFPQDGNEAAQLLTNAHLALNTGKSKGPNTIQFYQANMNVILETRRSLLVDLHYALEQNQFVLYFQAQVDLKTRCIIGAEALIRWQHPQRGMINPNDFIPLAEESGLIIPISEWILKTVCQHIKQWQTEGRNWSIAVNLSGIEFQSPHLLETISRILYESGIKPELLELEITESILMQDIEPAIATLKALRALGCPLALDDFGTGYSSLSYLSRFPVQKIKIDHSFLQEIQVSSGQKQKYLADIIIQLGKYLGLTVIAEGIETEAQAEYLTLKGCDEGQGYLFGQAQSFQEFKQQH